MAASKPVGYYMRIFHRYLGFFLAGIMAVYALSGMVLVFRNTDFLKDKTAIAKTVAPDLQAQQLGKALDIRRLRVERTEGDMLYFKDGSYNRATGEANYVEKKLPYVLDKMTHLHKANTNDPLFVLNLFFGASLFFFVMSSFWMFSPGTSVFRKGVYFALGGLVLTLVLLFV